MGYTAPDRDGPPRPDEGAVEAAHLNHYEGLAGDHHTQACQHGGEDIRINEPHVLAMGSVPSPDSGRLVRPRFCSKE